MSRSTCFVQFGLPLGAGIAGKNFVSVKRRKRYLQNFCEKTKLNFSKCFFVDLPFVIEYLLKGGIIFTSLTITFLLFAKKAGQYTFWQQSRIIAFSFFSESGAKIVHLRR